MMLRKILEHKDQISGVKWGSDTYRKRCTLSNDMRAANKLGKYNLRISPDPLLLRAEILKAPQIKCRVPVGKEAAVGEDEEDDGEEGEGPSLAKNPNNGSFNMDANDKFARRNHELCDDFVNEVLNSFQKKKGIIPGAVKEIPVNSITSRVDVIEASLVAEASQVDKASLVMKCAMDNARDTYINNSLGVFSLEKRALFQTQCLTREDLCLDCIVLPPHKEGEEAGLLIDYTKAPQYKYSHRITTKDKKGIASELDARLMVKIDQSDMLMDPCRFHNGHFQARTNVNFQGYYFECEDKNGCIPIDEVVAYKYKHLAKHFFIDVPSLIIAFLSDDREASMLYQQIKFLTNFCAGTQSQIAIASKFREIKENKRQDQYLANIAIKLNTKLSSGTTKACAWLTAGTSGDYGIDWIKEKSTLVIGIGIAMGRGNACEDVISASVLLDGFGMRDAHCAIVQDKLGGIADHTMEDIIKFCWNLFCIENEETPERVVIYRDGTSDFSQADSEIQSVRRALNQIEETNMKVPITCVICQSQHNIRMVPDWLVDISGNVFMVRGGGDGRSGNVFSGTCLDHSILQLDTKMTGLSIDEEAQSNIESTSNGKMQVFSEVDNSSDDFLLTAHGGLKGTSKPINYLIRLNENKIWGPAGATPLTKDNIKKCTYQMSFMYGTATKATREVPIIRYAKKLSNQLLSQLVFLRGSGTSWDGKTYQLHEPGDLESPRRYSVNVTDSETGRLIHRQYNLVDMPFRNHLAA
ncbi:hypothetical protein ACHAWF_016729 [Thalassiosira exigua]